MSTPMMLPVYMQAISPHTKSGFSLKSIGPGCSPQMMSPPSITAAVGEPGNAQREHGQHGRHAGGVGGGLRRDHALQLALAEAARPGARSAWRTRSS